MFRVVFLGTSASAPSAERGMPSIALVRDGSVFLLDCGEGTQRQMLQYGVSYAKVKAIILSHLHLDHTLGAFGLLETIRLNQPQQKVQIFGPRGSASLFGSKKNAQVHELLPNAQIDMGGFTLLAVKNKHGHIDSFSFIIEEKPKVRFYEEKAKSLGLRGPMFTQIQSHGMLKVNGKSVKLKDVTYSQQGKKISYSGDTAYCAAFVRASKNADLLIHEATFANEESALAKERFHSTIGDAARAAEKSGAKELVITHISNRYATQQFLLEQARASFKNSKIAQDGLVLEL